MNNRFLFLLALGAIVVFPSCDDDEDPGPSIVNPTTYAFERDGQSSVSYSGQTTRIAMAEELTSAVKGFVNSEVEALEMYANETAAGADANPFSDADLNASDKSIRSKTAASADFFASNTAEAAAIKQQFADWITAQYDEVSPNQAQLAAAGVAGQIADGTSTRYVNAQGLEYDQMVTKGLIGALMADQLLNNYLGTAVLDEGTNIDDNDVGMVVEGKTYTNMEHKWDEAYGYLYGAAGDGADPRPTVGGDDSFLNKYLGRVAYDLDFAGIAEDIYQAFKLGRAAIVAGDYTVRDEQAAILREKVSTIIGVRAVYYLQQGKQAFADGNTGGALHDLSEGFGFIYSLQFTRQPDKNAPYFSGTEVAQMISDLLGDGANGLWDVTPETLDALSNQIAGAFPFTVAEAAN